MESTVSIKKDLLIAIAIALAGIVILYFSHPATRFAFIPATVIAFVCFYSAGHYKKLPSPHFLAVYLLCIAVQCLHFAEEFVYGFYRRIAEINNFPSMSERYFVTFNMVAYALFILGAIGVYQKVRWAMIIAWFFIIAAVIGNSLWHLLMALRVGGYFPGLYTSFIYWIMAPFLLNRLVSKE